MKTTKQCAREARQLFRFCLVSGSLDESRARLVIRRLLESKRRGYLLVLGQFEHLLKQEYARHTAEIESAIPFPADLQAHVESRLKGVYGPGLTSVFLHSPALIGGMRIKVGSDVFDGSVQFALATLARSFGIPDMNGRRIPG